MKRLIFILLIFLSINVYSQDTIQIPSDELEEVFLAIDTLKMQDSIKTALINDLKIQMKNYEILSMQDSTIIGFKNEQIILLNEQIKLYDDRLKKIDKWYNKPWVGFIIGVATITGSSWVVHNVVN